MNLFPLSTCRPAARLLALILWLSLHAQVGFSAPPDEAARRSNDSTIRALGVLMDEAHTAVNVATDVSAAGDHFFAPGAFFNDGNKPLVSINASSVDFVYRGATSLRCDFQPNAPNQFGGFLFLNGVLQGNSKKPVPNFGEIGEAGLDVGRAVAVSFWARGRSGGEKVTVFMGGAGRDPETGLPLSDVVKPDSTPAIRRTIQLSKKWKQFRIPLVHVDLSYVLCGFGWGCAAELNPSGAVFYFDDVRFELGATAKNRRLAEPRFVRSFRTFDVQPDIHDDNTLDDIDFVLRNTAFLYDNALVILAYLADGKPASVRRAILIGDAIAYAGTHDREFLNGELRDAYPAGDYKLPPGWTPLGKVGLVGTPGFYDESKQEFFEVLQKQISVGNQAWTMLAMLALYERTGIESYLYTARRLGNYIFSHQQLEGTYRGFLFGSERDDDGVLHRVAYASTEHNLDVIAAFRNMNRITGESSWLAGAQHALEFVNQMWDPARKCYYTGTDNPELRNDNFLAQDPNWHQLPLDVQTWGVLALPETTERHPQLMSFVENTFRVNQQGLSGVDFNDDKDGIWFEGTAQAATAYAIMGDKVNARKYRQTLQKIQASKTSNFKGAIPAALHDGLTTGFGFSYFHRAHIGASAWNCFAQLGVNPYYLTVKRPARSPAPSLNSPTIVQVDAEAESKTVSVTVKIACVAGIKGAVARIKGENGDVQEIPLAPLSGGHVSGDWRGYARLEKNGAQKSRYDFQILADDTEGHRATGAKKRALVVF